jgi:chemotaxis protein methyltransferase CheR
MTKTTPPPPLPDLLVARLSRSVEKRLGLCFPPARWPDLVRGVRAAAPELGFDDARKCAECLTSESMDQRQIELLAAHLTIGETYFFRDPKAFATLETRVLPELIRERRGQPHGKRLRLWSAGCCTGEEAYSLAIAVCRAVPDWREWRISILGTDLNPRFLHKASGGIYGEWSFRGLPEEIKRCYFNERPDGRFEVVPRIKALVSFSPLNFVEDAYPSLRNNTNAMDVIFCRNVLMYFARGQARRVVGNLRRALVDGGWLFTSAAEVSADLFSDFTPADLPEAAAYRKNPQAQPPIFAASSFAPSPEWILPLIPAPPAPASPEPAARARELANAGRLDEALAACDEAIALHRIDAAAHYLRGMILQEQGALGEAAASLKRALYLDSDFVVAHFALGNLMQGSGRTADAQRCFNNTRALLRRHTPDALLPEADGLTAGRLLAILGLMEEAKP